eukprot:TRINITY_DN25781_c0_g1_i1.p1 TRINITY_DN25781_c0_g1~~TRINITY_DN25781_c0_g1_i1.p1  ORF type:complete len:119 (-),score=32.21 TRINITY_DN25781_c0_g1_i1:187-543(-)
MSGAGGHEALKQPANQDQGSDFVVDVVGEGGWFDIHLGADGLKLVIVADEGKGDGNDDDTLSESTCADLHWEEQAYTSANASPSQRVSAEDAGANDGKKRKRSVNTVEQDECKRARFD